MKTEQKNVIFNALGSTSNAFISLVFAIASTRINGVEKAGIFSFAFATACILYVLGSFIVRAFQVTDRSAEFSDTDYLYNRIITSIVMMIAVIGFVLIRGYSPYKSAIMIMVCLMKCAEAFAEVLYGFMQKNGALYMVGISLGAKSVCAMLGFVAVDLITRNLLIACAVAAAMYILFIFIIDIPQVKKTAISKTPFDLSVTFKLMRSALYTFILTILGVYLINAPRYAIDSMYSDSLQTVYGIIILPATFMCLLGQYIIQPALMRISISIENQDYFSLKEIVLKIFIVMIALGLGVFIVAYLLEEPVLSFVYGINLKEYKAHMMIIIVGSVFYGLETIASYILIAFRKTGIQAAVFAVVSVLALFASNVAVKYYQILGASYIYLLIMISLTVAFAVCLLAAMKKYKGDWLKG